MARRAKSKVLSRRQCAMFRNDPGRRSDNPHTARLGPWDTLRRTASLRRPSFAPAKIFRRAASRAELVRSRYHLSFARPSYFAGLPSCASIFSADYTIGTFGFDFRQGHPGRSSDQCSIRPIKNRQWRSSPANRFSGGRRYRSKLLP
jgi:hypothetical protein